MGLVGPEVAQRVFEAPIGEWRGPLRSERGVHFIRVAQHHPPSLPGFGELESYLRQDWTLDQQRRATAARLAELREDYRLHGRFPSIDDVSGGPLRRLGKDANWP